MKNRQNDKGAKEGQVTLYRSADGAVQVECLLRDETLWLTQKALSDLFGVKVPAISKHLKNIFESGELDGNRAVSILETTASDGIPPSATWCCPRKARHRSWRRLGAKGSGGWRPVNVLNRP